jgi:hypothetical protein
LRRRTSFTDQMAGLPDPDSTLAFREGIIRVRRVRFVGHSSPDALAAGN